MTALAAATTVLLPTVGSAAAARAAGLGGHPVASAGAVPADSVGNAAGPAALPPSEIAAAEPGAPPAGSGSGRPPAPAPASTPPDNSAGTPPQPSPPTTTAATSPEDSGSMSRPRMAAAVAMGASVDASSSPTGKVFVAPAFAGELGFGDGPLGFDLRLLSSQASGRSADAPPDRLSVDLMMAIRPWARRARDDAGWGARVRRAVTLGIGLGGERISAGPVHGYRAGLVMGVRADFPLTGVAGEPGELRLRLALRRLLAGEASVGAVRSRDSSEALAGLAVVF